MASSLRGRFHGIWNIASRITCELRPQLQQRCISFASSPSPCLQPVQSSLTRFQQNTLTTKTNFSTLCSQPTQIQPRLLSNQESTISVAPCRTKIMVSYNKGKQKSVKSVTQRFLRLDWGIWIRTKPGRHKRLWRKSSERKYYSKQHMFCNKQQSRLMDKMVTHYWKQPKYYVDSPYAGYQKRTNLQRFFPERPPFLP